jgi:hypothetical protein
MPKSAGFNILHADYVTLAASGAKSEDDVRSLRFFEVDLARDEDRIANEPSHRVGAWIDKVRRLELFISAEGRAPVENRRKERSTVSAEERTLSQWKADQLRAAHRAPPCTYQLRRLEGLVGFRWAPLDDRWDDNFTLYEAFAEVRQAPRYRAEGVERCVARWAQRQRDLYRRGALTQKRIQRLEATRFWTW